MTPCGCSVDNKGIWTQHVTLLSPSRMEAFPDFADKKGLSVIFVHCQVLFETCLWLFVVLSNRQGGGFLSLILQHKSEREQELTSVCVWGWLDLSRCRLVENRRVNSSRLNVHFHCSVFPAYFNPPRCLHRASLWKICTS